MPTYQSWLKNAQEKLSESGDSEAKLNSRLLLSFVAGKTQAQLFAFGETKLTKAEILQLENLLARRIQGEPLAYILGEWDFWDLTLKVSPATLIPRSDTEILVEQALFLAKGLLDKGKKKLNILDLGTGTGAIALAVAQALSPLCEKNGVALSIIGVDIRPEAVALARENAEKNALTNVKFWQSSWFSQIKEREFDLILSNPPYIDAKDPHLSQGDVRFEPKTALVAENRGFADLFHIIHTAPQYLCPQGWLLLEHGFNQGQRVRDFFNNQWQFIETMRDYGGNERITLAQFQP